MNACIKLNIWNMWAFAGVEHFWWKRIANGPYLNSVAGIRNFVLCSFTRKCAVMRRWRIYHEKPWKERRCMKCSFHFAPRTHRNCHSLFQWNLSRARRVCFLQHVYIRSASLQLAVCNGLSNPVKIASRKKSRPFARIIVAPRRCLRHFPFISWDSRKKFSITKILPRLPFV